MAKIISFANHKGGVAKTTSVASIGAILAEKKKKVLLIDLDAQANLTLSIYNGEAERDIADAITERKNLPIVSISKNLDLCPASVKLAGIELYLANCTNRREYILRELLEPVSGSYDYILLDCPPSLGLIVVNAFVASTEVYTPLMAEPLPVKGLGMLEDFIREVRETHNGGLTLSGIIITKWRGRALEKFMADSLRETYKEKVFKTVIRENISISEATLSGENILSYNANSNGAKDYKELTKEILKR